MRVSSLPRALTISLTVLATVACHRPIPASPALTDNLGMVQLSRSVDSGAFGAISGIVVSQDSQIIFEDYFGNSRPDTPVDMRSAGKSLTALAVGIAIDDGTLPSIETPVWQQFADRGPFRDDGPEKQGITVEDLLRMSSALDCDDWAPRSPGNEERMYRTKNWTDFALNIPTTPSSDRFSYCTAGVFLVGQMIERLAQTPFDVFMADRLFGPLGIHEVDWTRSPSGEVQSGGQLSLRARDTERLGRLVLQGGVWNGSRLLSERWISQMLTPHSQAGPNLGYGYLWWITSVGRTSDGQRIEAEMMIGNGGNLVVIVPTLKAVIVIQAKNYNRPGHFEMSMTLVRQFIIPELTRQQMSQNP